MAAPAQLARRDGAGRRGLGLRDQQDYLTTLLQIVPSAVVAVFVFAAGTVFVIAQVIAAPLGSRGIGELLKSFRGRLVLFFGVALLIASLSLAVFAPDVDELPFETKVAASVLAAATVAYAISAVFLVFGLSKEFMQPDRYARRLYRTRPLRRLTPERAFKSLRTTRQWLRTACARGESRDIIFALLAIRELVGRYARYATRKRKRELAATGEVDGIAEGRENVPAAPLTRLRRERPKEYTDTAAVVRTHWRRSRAEFFDSPSGKQDLPGWFGDEIGRAAVRSLETGIRGGMLLVRDADRILGTMRWAIYCFVDRDSPLLAEAGYLIDRIAEIGLFHEVAEEELYQKWCTYSTARILSDLVREFGERSCRAGRMELPLPPRRGEPPPAKSKTHTLRERAFVGWSLLRYDQSLTLRQQSPGGGSGPRGASDRRIRACVWPSARTVSRDGENSAPGLFEGDVRSAMAQDIRTGIVQDLAENLFEDLSWLETLQLERSDSLSDEQPSSSGDVRDFVGRLCNQLKGSEAVDATPRPGA